MTLLQILVLAAIQGLAELLPVSSSAHVIVAEKLMGADPSSPQMTFLLVMLHTGTMAAVILYFRPRWQARFLSASDPERAELAKALLAATAATGAVGLALKHWIERVWLSASARPEIEELFSNLPMIAAALAAVGLLIAWSGRREEGDRPVDLKRALAIGAVQGLCLPFRGFSRSGATISAALAAGVPRALAEDFSFALAVILTPPVIAREALRLARASAADGAAAGAGIFAPGLLGMAFSFCAGLLALRWLSDWLERGRWRWFGYYCLAASSGVLAVSAFLR